MNIEYLESFLAISKHKSLSKAAHSLYITQPTLSNRMANLESYLNLPLFKRSWEGIELTNHGMLFLPQALKILSRLDDFTSLSTNFKDLNNKPYLTSVDEMNTTYRIGINNYLVDKYAEVIVQSLLNKFPDIKLEIITASSKELLKYISFGILDYIVYYDFDSTLPNTDLINHEKMVIILCEKDYIFSNKDIYFLEKLKKPLYLNSNPALDNYLPYFKHFQTFINVEKAILVENLSLIKILIKEEQGFSLLPESIYRSKFKKENLFKLDIPEPLTGLPIYSTYGEIKKHFIIYSKYLNKLLSFRNLQKS